MIHGLVKKKQMFQTTYEPNMTGEKLIEGIIYKTKQTDQRVNEIDKLRSLPDIEFEMAEVGGTAIDKPVIQNVSYSNWAGVHFADPIPQELALPSDIRFREDLVMLKQAGNGKIAKGKVAKKNN